MTTQTEAFKRYLDDCDKHAIVPDIAGAFHFAWQEALAQPEQEPVAHFGSAYVNENGVHITTVLGPVAIPQDAKLYTAPPQRKPLTHEQMKKIWYSTKSMMGWYSFQEVSRAIEASHGIKE